MCMHHYRRGLSNCPRNEEVNRGKRPMIEKMHTKPSEGLRAFVRSYAANPPPDHPSIRRSAESRIRPNILGS